MLRTTVFHSVILVVALLLVAKDLVSAGVCYKKYLKRQGRCVKKIRRRGGSVDIGYENCCRLKNAKGWKPLSGTKICIKCHPIVDGGWSQWSKWTGCPVRCGWGDRSRTRICNNPLPQNGGLECKGPHQQKNRCYAGVPCPIHGKWGLWSEWSLCTKSCKSGGVQLRSRKCDNPKPQFGGYDCLGSSEDIKRCNEDKNCPIDGSWGLWSSWSTCNVLCGSGNMTRKRSCDKPVPQFKGKYCQGSSLDNLSCFRKCEIVKPSGSGTGSGNNYGSGSGSASGEGLEVDYENGYGNSSNPLTKPTAKVVEADLISGSGSGASSGDLEDVEPDADVSIKNKANPKTKLVTVEESGAGSGDGSDEDTRGSGTGDKLTDSESGDIKEGSGINGGSGSDGEDDLNEVSVESIHGKSSKKSNEQPKKIKISEPGWGNKFVEIN